jgi:hypothetical protein
VSACDCIDDVKASDMLFIATFFKPVLNDSINGYCNKAVSEVPALLYKETHM